MTRGEARQYDAFWPPSRLAVTRWSYLSRGKMVNSEGEAPLLKCQTGVLNVFFSHVLMPDVLSGRIDG
jgi:hypothetical protein